MKPLIKSLILASLCFCFVTSVSAQGLVQQYAGCSGPDCGTCEVVKLANGIIMWLIAFVFLLFALLLMRAGIKLVMSGGNPGALQDAKDSFINALIGFIIILAAWLIVDTLMRALVGSGEGSVGDRSGALVWSEITCTKQAKVNECKGKEDGGNCQVEIELDALRLEGIEVYEDGEVISESGIPSPSGTAPISTTPAVISGNLVTYAGRQFDSGIVGKVQYIATTFGLRVSGGYRSPERNRAVGGVANSYHLTGRAADFVGTQAQMEAAPQWARNNGAREALIHNAGSGTHLHVAW